MRLGIYGAGGFGREVLLLAREINGKSADFENILFVSDDAAERDVMGVEVVSLPELGARFPICDTVLAIAIGEPIIRAGKRRTLQSMGYRLATLVHPEVYVPPCATIGEGAIIYRGAALSCGVHVGENAAVTYNAVLSHDAVLGADSYMCALANLAGNVSVGERAFIGMNACIMQGVSAGDDSIIAMGAVVTRDVERGAVVMGNPARVTGENTQHRVFNTNHRG